MVTLKSFLKSIREKAKKNPKVIVFPEGNDPRIIKAVRMLSKEKIAFPIVIRKRAIKGIKTINHLKSEKFENYAKKLYELRKKKGFTLKNARKAMKDPNYFGTMMVKVGEADGMISGAMSKSAMVLRPAFQIIKTKKRSSMVSGWFFMEVRKKIKVFADCAVNINPTSEELAKIAIDTAETAKKFGITPRVALLSFSTKGSGDHPLAKKVSDAVAIVKRKRPDIMVDGELQLDSALIPSVCKIKCPNCRLKGNATVIIFPDLQSGNIAYKIIQRFIKMKTTGPMLQGLKKPVNDLSRGCYYMDIVNVAAMTCLQIEK